MLTVIADKKISLIQKEFTLAFPFLKLEFFYKTHSPLRKKSKDNIIESDVVLKEARNLTGKALIVIHEMMSVKTLEQLFLEKFGIETQVFRKSGQLWLEITMTDDWTLKRQNDEGKELSFLKRS